MANITTKANVQSSKWAMYSDEIWYVGSTKVLPMCYTVVDVHIFYLFYIFVLIS